MAKGSKSLLVIMLLGLVLRLINLGQSFWLDEASQGQMSSQSISWIWNSRSGDFHPPLFYLISHFWILFGRSEVWLRLPSVFFGLLNILLVYKFAQILFPDLKRKIFKLTVTSQDLAAVLIATNPFHIYYSQEFRSYSLLCLLGTLSMLLFYKKNYLLLGVVNAALLYTHYSSIFLIFTQIIIWVFYIKSSFKKFTSSFGITLVLYLPWIPQFASQLGSGVNIDVYFPGWKSLLSVSPLKIFPLTIFKLVAGRINFVSQYIYVIYIIFVLGAVFFSIRFTRLHRNFLFTWLVTPILIMVITSFFFPQNQPFRVIYVIPALVLIFTQICFRFPKSMITILLYISIVGNITYYTRPRVQREQWRQTINFLSQESSSDSSIIVKFSDRFSPFYWYNPQLTVAAALTHFPSDPSDVVSRLGYLASSEYRRVYVLDYLGELTDPARYVDVTLENLGFSLEHTYNFEGVGFIRYFVRKI